MMRLMRYLMLLLAGVFVMAALRTIMGAFQQSMRGPTTRQPARAERPPEFAPGGELKKCAVCGVYNAAAISVTKVRGGETLYYCSSECRANGAA